MIEKYLKWRISLWTFKRDVKWYDIFFIHSDILMMRLFDLICDDENKPNEVGR